MGQQQAVQAGKHADRPQRGHAHCLPELPVLSWHAVLSQQPQKLKKCLKQRLWWSQQQQLQHQQHICLKQLLLMAQTNAMQQLRVLWEQCL